MNAWWRLCIGVLLTARSAEYHKKVPCMHFYVKALLPRSPNADFLSEGRTRRRTPRTADDDQGQFRDKR